MLIKLTSPAYITFIASVILLISLLIPTSISLYDADTDTKRVEKFDFKNRLVMILLLSLPLAIHVYSINCLQVGNCIVWSWILATIIITWILIFLVIAFAF